MHDLFFIAVYKTTEPNKHSALEVIKCIADRKSAFNIWFDYTSQGFKHIEVRNCESGCIIDFNHGIWGETKPL